MTGPRRKRPHPVLTLLGFIAIGYALGWAMWGVGFTIAHVEVLFGLGSGR